MKSLKEKIEVMQAALDGKEIEIKYLRHDKDFKTPIKDIEWNWQIADYRIKPEPMEFWVNVYNDGSLSYVHESKEMAIERSKLSSYIKTIKVREVIE